MFSGTEKDSNSTLHFLQMPSHTGMTLGIVGHVGDGEGLEGWGRSVLELDPRAASTDHGLMRVLQVIDCLSDTTCSTKHA